MRRASTFFAVLVSWVLSALALLGAAWIVPGADVKGFGGALAAAAVIAMLNAILPPVVAALRLPFVAALGFLIVLVLDALMLLAADRITDGDLTIDSFWSALGVALAAAAIGVVLDIVLGTNDDDTYTFRVIQRIARRSGERDGDGRSGDRLPRDRRPRAAGAAAGDPERQRAEHGALARGGVAPPRGVGDRPLVADRREPGGHPARVERRHSRLPLGREGDGDADGLLGARRLRGDRAPPSRAAGGCSRTAARAAATSSRARPTTSS